MAQDHHHARANAYRAEQLFGVALCGALGGIMARRYFNGMVRCLFGPSEVHYQRVLLGLEGKLSSWLSLKVAAGPDFRDYNPNAAVNNLNPIYPFVEGTVTATITPNQSLSFYTKEWQWVSSAGLVPYYDS